MTEILLGFSAASWGFTVTAVAYALYQFAYRPWIAAKQLYASLDTRLTALEQDQKLRKVMTPDNERQYRAEQRMAMARMFANDE